MKDFPRTSPPGIGDSIPAQNRKPKKTGPKKIQVNQPVAFRKCHAMIVRVDRNVQN